MPVAQFILHPLQRRSAPADLERRLAGSCVAEAERGALSTPGHQAHAAGPSGQAIRPQGNCAGSGQCCHGPGQPAACGTTCRQQMRRGMRSQSPITSTSADDVPRRSDAPLVEHVGISNLCCHADTWSRMPLPETCLPNTGCLFVGPVAPQSSHTVCVAGLQVLQHGQAVPVLETAARCH